MRMSTGGDDRQTLITKASFNFLLTFCQSSMPRQHLVYLPIIASFNLWRGGQQSEIGLGISTETGKYAVYGPL